MKRRSFFGSLFAAVAAPLAAKAAETIDDATEAISGAEEKKQFVSLTGRFSGKYTTDDGWIMMCSAEPITARLADEQWLHK